MSFKIPTLVATLLIVLVVGTYVAKHDFGEIADSRIIDVPSREASKGCSWTSKVFKRSGVTVFEEACASESWMTFSETSDTTIVGISKDNPDHKFTIQLFLKGETTTPIDVVEEWYARLSKEEQKKCTIQNADTPLKYFSDGRLLVTEEPHRTAHKTRYKIDVKPEITKEIFEGSGGFPNNNDNDYICGHLVGSRFTAHVPYFEFDDRSPNKYLFVGSYGFDGPPIDLNSIRF